MANSIIVIIIVCVLHLCEFIIPKHNGKALNFAEMLRMSRNLGILIGSLSKDVVTVSEDGDGGSSQTSNHVVPLTQ